MGLEPLTQDIFKFQEGKQLELCVLHWGSAGHPFSIYVLTREGINAKTITSTSDRNVAAEVFRILNIPLMVSAGAGSITCRRGQVFVHAFIRLGGMVYLPLFSGYLTCGRGLVWPPGHFEDSVEGPGLLRSITGTDPAAGAEISETVPTNARWKLISVRAPLVTNATVTNRRVQLIIDDGATTLMMADDGYDQPASVTVYHRLSAAQFRGGIGLDVNTPLPATPIFLFQGWRIRTSTANLQAGDDYGAPQLLVEEWIEE